MGQAKSWKCETFLQAIMITASFEFQLQGLKQQAIMCSWQVSTNLSQVR